MITDDDRIFLKSWQTKRLVANTRMTYAPAPSFDKLSIVVYFYRNVLDEPSSFLFTKCAILETWRQLGALKTILVTNRYSEPLTDFAEKHPYYVTLQIESSLRPGTTEDLSIDCLTKLGSRFDTEYALTVQDDGFPIRPGIEKFIGKWDFIGTPYRRANLLGLCAGTLRRHWPANGGFSLRSKRLCKLVSESFDPTWYKTLSPEERSEDIFITDILPRHNRMFAKKIKWADSYVAANFAYDASLPKNISKHPLGFHNAHAFRELSERGMISQP